MIKTIDYLLGWFAELADSARDILGFIPALGATLVFLLFLTYISVRCTKGILRFVLLALIIVLGLGFIFFIMLADGMSEGW